ncbi:sesquipedalian-1 [Ochlerotatus camptorhynchus]|uniref:sesquipedalian-1 n=1 Tax=Ochlerotatus camptorhynchus TaxID=644619 RepID=UPI0031DA5D28
MMKINEKNLCMFATTPPVDLEGWLNKRGEVNKSWQRRWFVLKGNLLFYFERKGDREPLGMIILEGCTVELAEEGEQYCFQIIFHGPNNRTYYLSTESQSNMEQWMKALTCAGYDYMKLMVAELQRQLDEIEGCKEKTPETTPLPPPKAPPRRQNPFNRPPPPPVECASNTVFDPCAAALPMAASHFSPRAVRKAPPPPLVSPSSQPASNITNGRSQLSSAHSSGGSVLNVDLLAAGGEGGGTRSDEFGFEQMHRLLGVPILADLKARKMAMEKSEPPLIMF